MPLFLQKVPFLNHKNTLRLWIKTPSVALKLVEQTRELNIFKLQPNSNKKNWRKTPKVHVNFNIVLLC